MADRVVSYVFRGDLTQLRASLAAAGQSVGKFGTELTALDARGAKMRAGLTSVGDTAGKVGLVAAAGLGVAVKAAIDWESAWAGVQKTVDGSAGQMAKLEGELRELAKTLPASHQEIAAVAEAAGQLGIQRDSVALFTKTMIELGETTNLTANDAATSLARIQNIMGTSTNDIARMGSTIVDLGNNSATTEAEIVALSTRLAAAGKQAGLTEADIFAISSTLTSVGVESEAGGTAMSKVFTAVSDAARDGGDNLETFARVAGISGEKFQRLFAEDGAAAIGLFVEGMGNLSAAGGNTTQVFKDLGLTDQRLMRAILSAGSASGLWADQLELASEAWAKTGDNSALAIEAAKRFGTTASQMRVSWNNIKDAAIDFGEAALPVLAAAAEKAAGLAQTLAGLPGPVKTTGTALLGVTAVLGGGLWFTAKTVSAVTGMRTALGNLGVSADKSSRAMKGVARGASAVGLAFAGLAIGESLQKVGDETLPGLEALTKQLIELSEAARGGVIAAEFDSIGESIARLTDKNLAVKFNDNFADAIGFGHGTAFREATAEIELLDSALANLVGTGNADLAADALQNLGAAQGLTAAEFAKLKGLLPGYDEALQGQANAADLSADAQDDLGAAAAGAVPPLEAQADAIKDATEAMREQRSEAIRGLNAQINYQASLDDARKALKDNGKTLDITTEKGRANKTALLGVASAWNEQSAAAKNAPGAHRAAIGSFVDLATKMGMSEDKARRLAQRILELPDKRVKVTADTSQAEGAIAGIGRSLINLDGRTARTYVTTTYNDVFNRDASGGIQRRAGGGHIAGPGTGTSDSIPAYLSNGEYVVKAAAVAKYGVAMFDRLNTMRFAEGGHVQRFASGGQAKSRERAFDLSGDLGVRGVRQEIREFRRAVREAGGEWTKGMDRMTDRAIKVTRAFGRYEKQLDRAQGRLRDLRSDRRDLKASASGVFDNDVFGGGTLDSVFLQLQADRNDARTQKQLLKNADKLGVNKNALAMLAQTDDLAALGDIDTRAEARRLNRLLAQRSAAQQAVGNFAGNEVFGQAIKQQSRTMNRLDRRMDRLDKTLNNLEGRVESGARRGIADRDRHGRQNRRAG